jgi:hypothetical protein
MSRVVIYCTTDELESLASLKTAEEAAGNRVSFINAAAFSPAQLENADKIYVHARDLDRISPAYLARKTEVEVIEEAGSQPASRPDADPESSKVSTAEPAKPETKPAKPARKAQTPGSHKPKGKAK